MDGKNIEEVIALKPKMYSVIVDKQINKAKGIPKVVSKKIDHDTYKLAVYTPIETIEKFHVIKSDKHELSTVCQRKIGLSSYDDKRYYIDLINSRAHGHYKNKK